MTLRVFILSLSCLLIACIGESAPSTEQDVALQFQCGTETCQNDEYCEVVVSDVPEFATGFESYACVAMPVCPATTTDPCVCLSHQTCGYGNGEFGGTCSTDGTQVTLRCNIGG